MTYTAITPPTTGTTISTSNFGIPVVNAITEMWQGQAAGDMAYFSSATTMARLAGGTANAGKILRLNSSGNAPEWSGNSETQLIAGTVVSGTIAAGGTIAFSGLDQNFYDLKIRIMAYTSYANWAALYADINDDLDASHYWRKNINFTNAVGIVNFNNLYPRLLLYVGQYNPGIYLPAIWEITIFGYSHSNIYKSAWIKSFSATTLDDDVEANSCIYNSVCVWKNTDPITSLKFYWAQSADWIEPSRIQVYGMK